MLVLVVLLLVVYFCLFVGGDGAAAGCGGGFGVAVVIVVVLRCSCIFLCAYYACWLACVSIGLFVCGAWLLICLFARGACWLVCSFFCVRVHVAGGRDPEEHSDDRAHWVREDGDCPTRGEDVSGTLHQGSYSLCRRFVRWCFYSFVRLLFPFFSIFVRFFVSRFLSSSNAYSLLFDFSFDFSFSFSLAFSFS